MKETKHWPHLTLHHIPHSVCVFAQGGLLSVVGNGPKLAGLKEHWWSLAGVPQRRKRRKVVWGGREQRESAEAQGWQ